MPDASERTPTIRRDGSTFTLDDHEPIIWFEIADAVTGEVIWKVMDRRLSTPDSPATLLAGVVQPALQQERTAWDGTATLIRLPLTALSSIGVEVKYLRHGETPPTMRQVFPESGSAAPLERQRRYLISVLRRDGIVLQQFQMN